MEETIHGLHVKDYTDLSPDALEEIILLEEQLQKEIKNYLNMIKEGEIDQLSTNLRWLLEDSESLRDYALECQEEILIDMEEQEHINNADSEYCEMSDYNCDDCYISECSSSACAR